MNDIHTYSSINNVQKFTAKHKTSNLVLFIFSYFCIVLSSFLISSRLNWNGIFCTRMSLDDAKLL